MKKFFFFSAGADTLKILLSFAVGGLLGDVFLHLLPEAWNDKVLNKGISLKINTLIELASIYCQNQTKSIFSL